MKEQKYHIIQLGCASNQADGNHIEHYLNNSGSIITNNLIDADIIIIMTCGFSKKQYEETIDVVTKVNNQKQNNAEIWIGGCVPAINKSFYNELPFNINKFFTPRNFEGVFNANKQTQKLKHINNSQISHNKLNAYPIRIVNGCTENCSYCVIKSAGGETKSKTIAQIIDKIKTLDKKITSISLVGEEVGAYGKDTNETLLSLIEKIILIKPKINITFSSIHPKYFIVDFEHFLRIFKYKNIIPLLPLPIQSGSNNVLALMKRNYLIEDVFYHINSFLKEFPAVKISTDIMVGYPGETWDDFLLTQEMLNDIPISALDCFKFDDMKEIGNTISEEEKIKRLKLISLTFFRKFCKENEIYNSKELQVFVKNNLIPLNLNL